MRENNTDGEVSAAPDWNIINLQLDPALFLRNERELGQLGPEVSDGVFTFITTRAGHLRHVRQGRLGGGVQALNREHQVEPGGAMVYPHSPAGSRTHRGYGSGWSYCQLNHGW